MIEQVLEDPQVQEYLLKAKNHQRLLYRHSMNVAEITELVCERYNITGESLIATLYGAIYHDMGKLRISRDILNKKGELSVEERIVINQHTIIPPEELPLGLPELSKDIILHHHEKLDGSGYPEGIRNLSTEVSIVEVADIYDAMRSKRSYKEAYSRKQVFQFLDSMVIFGKLDGEVVRKVWEVTKT